MPRTNSESSLVPDWIVDLIAGWSSGAAAVVLVQPIDTILTRWQAVPLASGSIRGMALSFYQSAGFAALYRGATPMIASVPVQNALLMSGYGFGERWFGCDKEEDSSRRLGAIFLGGFTGGLLQSFLMSPVEFVKVAQQCSSEESPSTRRIVQSMRWSQNWAIGLNATLMRDGIPHGVWFVVYDVCKEALINDSYRDQVDDCNNLSAHVPLISGAVAATVAWGVGYPADLIKTRIQANASAFVNSTMVNDTIVSIARDLVQEANGNYVKGLYRGFGMKLARSIPASMIGFLVYETIKEQIKKI